MVEYFSDKILSAESLAVLNQGRELWRAYFSYIDVYTVREKLKFNLPDVGWYQIRNALAERNKSADLPPVSFKPFEQSYEVLTLKLRPMVDSLGFLR
jgi:hypothetical protein